MVEETLVTALQGYVSGRIYPDVAPIDAATPWITFQQVGGQGTAALRGVAALQNARMQINVWAESRKECTTIMNQILAALTTDAIRATPIGAAVSIYESETKLYGARLDFSIWFNP